MELESEHYKLSIKVGEDERQLVYCDLNLCLPGFKPFWMGYFAAKSNKTYNNGEQRSLTQN